MLKVYEKYMHRCLELAAKGKGFVAPNPMVGSVIVYQDKVIGEGFHRKYGEAHAEVNAIRSVKDQQMLKESTLYVNLEPCSHYGKTPPCAELIINKKIPKVIIGMKDPFPKVSGQGIKMLTDNGVEVVSGILESESSQLNVRFVTMVTKQRPYIILKWAQSSDGFIDRFREINDGQRPVHFSNEYTQILVHKLRAEEAAIMVGNRTWLLDNPLLNVRYWDGLNPVVIKPDSKKNIETVLKDLALQGIQSLIVEGGAKLLESFIQSGYWDEARIEINPVKLKTGVKAPAITGNLETVQNCEKSMILIHKN
ncbi:MAG: bifunctional diaminohydroxyphosphoribosylaminopyrimidine deaminase/5-amino-6-(5-phosphoribosylamino)uracil reductase RibD [Bacteroidales bacterium]|nr:bifunctional diaminohydroxyphosphoribosylaminopyrimidine deaminase/5-amino-6-(5-phosphoribosylamino)uracil reductase RibD [Bacteroidales bacterium]